MASPKKWNISYHQVGWMLSSEWLSTLRTGAFASLLLPKRLSNRVCSSYSISLFIQQIIKTCCMQNPVDHLNRNC